MFFGKDIDWASRDSFVRGRRPARAAVAEGNINKALHSSCGLGPVLSRLALVLDSWENSRCPCFWRVKTAQYIQVWMSKRWLTKSEKDYAWKAGRSWAPTSAVCPTTSAAIRPLWYTANIIPRRTCPRMAVNKDITVPSRLVLMVGTCLPNLKTVMRLITRGICWKSWSPSSRWFKRRWGGYSHRPARCLGSSSRLLMKILILAAISKMNLRYTQRRTISPHSVNLKNC